MILFWLISVSSEVQSVSICNLQVGTTLQDVCRNSSSFLFFLVSRRNVIKKKHKAQTSTQGVYKKSDWGVEEKITRKS